MCTKLKVATMYITPGMVIQYKTLSAIKQGRFGLTGGQFPNVREDRLGTIWAGYFGNRAVIEVEGFREKGIGFGKDNKPTKIACLFDNVGDVAVITTDAVGEVSKIHHRMPCIIEDEMAWLKEGILKKADSDIQLKLI